MTQQNQVTHALVEHSIEDLHPDRENNNLLLPLVILIANPA